MAKFIKNNSGATASWAGQEIADGAYYQVELAEETAWRTNDTVIADVSSGALVVARDDSGATDYGPALGIAYLLDADPTPRDSNGSPIFRAKATATGWHYEPRALDFTTAKHQSLYNRKHDGAGIGDGSDYGDASLKFFDGAGDELVQGGAESDTAFQVRLATDCVKTFLDWQTTYDMDMVGGMLFVKGAPAEDAYLWTIVAPDIPENMGGSVPHVAGGWNLKFFNVIDKIVVNGRGSKTILYDPVYNSNKFRTIVKHGAGEQINIQIVFEGFKA